LLLSLLPLLLPPPLLLPVVVELPLHKEWQPIF
jgi:hypothetical protein